MGRPTKLTPEVLEEICEATSHTSEGLMHLCAKNQHWPIPRNIRKRIREDEEFRHKYAQAKEDQAHLIVEEILNIADDDSRDTITKKNKDGSEYEVCNGEWIARSRLRVDTRKWLAGKLFPKMYGEKFTAPPEEKDNSEIDNDRELAQKCIKSIP